MNRYFNSAVRRSKSEHAKNVLLGKVRSAMLQNKSLMLETNKIDYWFDIIRKEFPDIGLKKVTRGIVINERKS